MFQSFLRTKQSIKDVTSKKGVSLEEGTLSVSCFCVVVARQLSTTLANMSGIGFVFDALLISN